MQISNKLNSLTVIYITVGFFCCLEAIQIFTPNAYDSALQTDGKLIIVGKVLDNNLSKIFIARYNVDGTLDTTFDSTGFIIKSVGTECAANAVVLQSNGKIVIGGYTILNNVAQFLLLRYNSDGSIDNSFGISGIVTTHIGDLSYIYDIGLQNTTNEIVCCGLSVTSGISSITVARYVNNGINDGALDLTYGSDGIVTTSVGLASQANSIAIQTDNKVVVGGYGSIDGYNQFVVARYTTSGNPDSSFNNTGVVVTTINNSDQINSIALQPTGEIVVGGVSNQSFALVRYTANGNLDTTFNGTGIVVDTSIASPSQINHIVLDSLSNILATGYSSKNVLITARYTSSGLLDTSFGNQGILTFQNSTAFEGTKVIMQPNSKFINLSTLQSGNFALRFNLAGVIDTTYGSRVSSQNMINGIMTGLILSNSGALSRNVVWASHKLPYVPNFGGITFNYPQNFFLNAPNVSVTIEYLASANKKMATPMIISNSNTSTKIFVSVGQKNVDFIEPNSGEVVVHIYALGEPVL